MMPDSDDNDLAVFSNLPGFSFGQFSTNVTPLEFEIFDGISDFDPMAYEQDLNTNLQRMNVFFGMDFDVTTPTENNTHTASLEYILLGVFGSIVVIFLLCQIYIHCRTYIAKKDNWRISNHNWWSVVRPGSNSISLENDTTVWAHHYESYSAVPFSRGLLYDTEHTPCKLRRLLSDKCNESSSDTGTEKRSQVLESTGSRSLRSCGSLSTLSLLGSNLESRVNPYLLQTDTIVKVIQST